jgi:hypothetical protein
MKTGYTLSKNFRQSISEIKEKMLLIIDSMNFIYLFEYFRDVRHVRDVLVTPKF